MMVEQCHRGVPLTRGTPPAGQEPRRRSRPLMADVRPARFGMTGAVGLKDTEIQVIPRDDEAGWSPPATMLFGCATSAGFAGEKTRSLRIL